MKARPSQTYTAAFRAAPWHCALSLLVLIPCTLATEVRAVDGFGWDIERDHVSLNGLWNVLPGHGEAEVWEPGVAAGLGPWQSVSTPGVLLPEADTEAIRETQCVWARRTFELSPEQAARDALLRWGSVDFGATAWLNGRHLGLHGTKGPCTLPVPDGVLRSGENVLMLKVRGWAGVPRGASGFPLVPTGAAIEGWGSKRPAIFDDVWLEFYDRAYMKWILALPDLEDKSVTFRVWPDGVAELPAEMEIRAVVRPQDSAEVSGEARAATAPTGEPTDVRVPLRELHPWCPQDPFLYTAELQLGAGGEPCDVARFPFGMRQIQVAEGHYRLNGRRLRLRGSNLVNEWRWGDTFNREVKRYLVDEGRAMNLGCFRTHTLPPPATWADTCDEHGVMILAELPVLYNYKEFRFTDEEWAIFHENVLRDATGWVTKLWNHPAIVMWVLSNESREDAEWEKGPYRDHILALDPTRPTMRTGGHTEETRDLHTCGNFSYGCEGDILHTVR
ncbi:MAG: glycoside hydrolase family 2 TIM barrel-domain containing protein, partial [Candidatus Brocadiaceae bacterium]